MTPNNELIRTVCNSLFTDFSEHMTSEETAQYLDEYDAELSDIYTETYDLRCGTEYIASRLNKTMSLYTSNRGCYNAAVDVATTLLCLAPQEYANKFIFK